MASICIFAIQVHKGCIIESLNSLPGSQGALAITQRSIHASAQSQSRLPCAGGIQLFLALTKAFDRLPRPLPLEALQRVKLTPQLQSVLLARDIDARYYIDVSSTSRCIPVRIGARQGCSSAPYFWSTAMVLLLDNLQKTVPLQWIKDHVTIFADDLHIFCCFRSDLELNDALLFLMK